MPVYALEIKNVFEPAKFANIGSFLNVVIPLILLIAALLFLGMFFWAGARFITAGDNKETVDTAKKTITYAISGLAIIFLSYLGIKLLSFFFNIQSPL